MYTKSFLEVRWPWILKAEENLNREGKWARAILAQSQENKV
jgi:hypothetical protein